MCVGAVGRLTRNYQGRISGPPLNTARRRLSGSCESKFERSTGLEVSPTSQESNVESIELVGCCSPNVPALTSNRYNLVLQDTMAYVPGFQNDVFIRHGDDRDWINLFSDRITKA